CPCPFGPPGSGREAPARSRGVIETTSVLIPSGGHRRPRVQHRGSEAFLDECACIQTIRATIPVRPGEGDKANHRSLLWRSPPTACSRLDCHPVGAWQRGAL